MLIGRASIVELPAAPDVRLGRAARRCSATRSSSWPSPAACCTHADPTANGSAIVYEAIPAERLSFRWISGRRRRAARRRSRSPSSRLRSARSLHLRETRLDGAHLARSAFLACARVPEAPARRSSTASSTRWPTRPAAGSWSSSAGRRRARERSRSRLPGDAPGRGEASRGAGGRRSRARRARRPAGGVPPHARFRSPKPPDGCTTSARRGTGDSTSWRAGSTRPR